MPRRIVPPHLGEGLVVRRLIVAAPEAAVVKGLVEAHEGIANVFAESGGDLHLVAPVDREAELDALLVSIDELLRSIRAPR